MTGKKHLFIGFGDLASRCAQALIDDGDTVVGIARSERPTQVGLEFWQGDVTSESILQRIREAYFDSVVITLTPSGRREEDYRRAYYAPVKALLQNWQLGNAPERILYISSTGVYAQSNGEVVDENSPAEPTSPTQVILRETEELLLNSAYRATVIRFSGIYGPKRNYLLRQVVLGNGGNDQYSNRIHEEDCSGVMYFLVNLPIDQLQKIYLATDKTPVTSRDIRVWLAGELGIDPNTLSEPEVSPMGKAKRCHSALLENSGYEFKYPTYKSGYISCLAFFRRLETGVR